MPLTPDDPRLTAYLLGELDDAERAEIEAALNADPSLRGEVESLLTTARLLREEFALEEQPALSEAQRARLERSIADGEAGPQPRDVLPFPAWRTRQFWLRAGISTAAALVLVALWLPWQFQRHHDDQFAIHDQPQADVTETATADVAKAHAPADPPEADSHRKSTDTRIAGLEEQIERLRAQGAEHALPPPPSSPPAAGIAPEYGHSDRAGRSSPARHAVAPIVVGGRVIAENEEPEVLRRRHATRPQGVPATQGFDFLRFSTRGRFDIEGAPLDAARELVDAFNLADAESYDPIVHNPFHVTLDSPLSTFAIDVDTASYANVRRFLSRGQMPPPEAVRIEEMVNYFSYDYAAPSPGDSDPFKANVEIGPAPWQPEHRLVRIGLKGMEIPHDDRPATNLAFLIDVSGSMGPANRLPLVKQGLRLLVENLTVDDRVAIVVYAGQSGVVLDSTYVADRRTILDAIDALEARGSTNAGDGIALAYQMARDHFIEGGVNRIILCTDGDFNVGVTGRGELGRVVEEKTKETGVSLTVLGFGMGNLKDDMLEHISSRGKGRYAYIDTLDEAKKLFVEELSGTLVTIAKDVKIQVEFNPAEVAAYRLIGYENRLLAARDFNDDTKDGGDIGAGHTVTALYEVVPVRKVGSGGDPVGRRGSGLEDAVAARTAGDSDRVAEVDPLRYQRPAELTDLARTSGEMLTLRLRYKAPDGDVSTLIEFPARDESEHGLPAGTLDETSPDFRFAAAVAAFGMILRDSPHKGDTTFESIRAWAAAGLANDPHSHRARFLELVRQAESITPDVQ